MTSKQQEKHKKKKNSLSCTFLVAFILIRPFSFSIRKLVLFETKRHRKFASMAHIRLVPELPDKSVIRYTQLWIGLDIVPPRPHRKRTNQDKNKICPHNFSLDIICHWYTTGKLKELKLYFASFPLV